MTFVAMELPADAKSSDPGSMPIATRVTKGILGAEENIGGAATSIMSGFSDTVVVINMTIFGY